MDNIKNKFPELRYFIENLKGYEVLYYKEDSIHNEYPLDVKEAKEIISTIEILEQQLKKKDEVISKAVEYIKNNKNKAYAPYGDNEDEDFEIALFEEDITNLLQILEDKEVE